MEGQINNAPTKNRYSNEELAEFKIIILNKINETQKNLNSLKKAIQGSEENCTGKPHLKQEESQLSQNNEEIMAQFGRLNKFLTQLNNALIRIGNGTYGICFTTGKLIPKERLLCVPHTTSIIEVKLKKTA